MSSEESSTTARPARASAGVDPAALMAIRNLELRARVVVEGFWSGIHRSPYHGFSVEFTEYRQYSPGDDPRYLDWKLFARIDRYYIRKYEDETNLRLHILVDQSASMNYGTTGYTKAEYGATLAATLIHFLSQQGDAVGLLRFDEEVREYLPARNRPGHKRRLMLALEQPAEGRGTDLTVPLDRVQQIITKRGMMLLISDLLAPVDRLEKQLAALLARGHEVTLFQILDPRELDFDFEKPGRFHDMESREGLFIHPSEARASYLEKFQAHLQKLDDLCRGLGVPCHRFSTSEPMDLALFEFFRDRMSRQGKTGRVRPNTRS